jgi:hypothetical protein
MLRQDRPGNLRTLPAPAVAPVIYAGYIVRQKRIPGPVYATNLLFYRSTQALMSFRR